MLRLYSKILQWFFGTKLKNKLLTHKLWEEIIVETQNIPKPISTSTNVDNGDYKLHCTKN